MAFDRMIDYGRQVGLSIKQMLENLPPEFRVYDDFMSQQIIIEYRNHKIAVRTDALRNEHDIWRVIDRLKRDSESYERDRYESYQRGINKPPVAQQVAIPKEVPNDVARRIKLLLLEDV